MSTTWSRPTDRTEHANQSFPRLLPDDIPSMSEIAEAIIVENNGNLNKGLSELREVYTVPPKPEAAPAETRRHSWRGTGIINEVPKVVPRIFSGASTFSWTRLNQHAAHSDLVVSDRTGKVCHITDLVCPNGNERCKVTELVCSNAKNPNRVCPGADVGNIALAEESESDLRKDETSQAEVKFAARNKSDSPLKDPPSDDSAVSSSEKLHPKSACEENGRKNITVCSEQTSEAFCMGNISSASFSRKGKVLSNLNGEESAKFDAQLKQYAHQMYVHDQHTDVTINVGKYTFSAHSLVLGCRSQYFHNLLLEGAGRKGEILLTVPPSVSTPVAFQYILNYMYGGEYMITVENAAEVYAAALNLKMYELADRLYDLLDCVNMNNVLTILETSEAFGVENAYDKAYKWVMNNVRQLISSPEFLRLDMCILMKLLSSDDLDVSSELVVAEAVLAWVNHNRESRHIYAAELMSCVRFPLMTQKELFECACLDKIIMAHPDIQLAFGQTSWYFICKTYGQGEECKCMYNICARPRNRHHLDVTEMVSQAFQDQTTELSGKVQEICRCTTGNSKTQELEDKSKAQTCSKTAEKSRTQEIRSKNKDNYRPIPQSHASCPETGFFNNEICNSSQNVQPKFLLPTSDVVPKVEPRLPALCSAEVSAPSASTLSSCPSLLAVGGYNPDDWNNDLQAKAVSSYSIHHNQWTELSTMPHPRVHHAVCYLGNCIYLIGGCDPFDKGKLAPLHECYKFDTYTNIWSTIPPMKTARMLHGVCTLYGKIYVIGGQDGSGRILASVECFNSKKNKWTDIAPLPVPIKCAGVARHLGQIHVAGGCSEVDGRKVILDSVYSYDSVKNRWIQRSKLRIPRQNLCLANICGKLYMCGGLAPCGLEATGSNLKSISSVDEFDDITNRWNKVAELSIPRHEAGCAVFGTHLFVVGGRSTLTDTALNSAECLNVKTCQWEEGVAHMDLPTVGSKCIVPTYNVGSQCACCGFRPETCPKRTPTM